ncbi:MAG: efflux RND transporter periplasmic adaptor subunit [Thermoanaerobaculia bacterium]
MNRAMPWILGAGVALAWGVRTAVPAPTRPNAPEPPSGGLTLDANLLVERDVGVGTRMGGIIDSIQAERGESVHKGQALATLDQREFELDRRAADAAFSAAEADFKRYQELFGQKLASKAELEQRRARFEQARVDLEKAKLVIDRSVIRAPFDGVIVDRTARVGQKVQISDTTPLFKITALEPLFARVYVNEGWLGRLRTGDAASVVSSKFPRAHCTGKITFLAPVIDSGSGTFQVIVTLPRASDSIFRPGSSVKITFNPRRAPARE